VESIRRLHVEVTVGVKPMGNLRPWNSVKFSKWPREDRVKLYFQNKFDGRIEHKTNKLLNHDITETASKSFGGHEYEKWLVLGEQNEPREEIRKEFTKYGVKVHYMDEVLNETRLTGTPRGATARLLQIMARFVTDESKRSLPGKAKSSDNREELSR
jgi:hypothetical protein